MGSAPSNRVTSQGYQDDLQNLNQNFVEPNIQKINYDSLDNEQLCEEISLNIEKFELILSFIDELKTASNILKNKRAFKSFIFLSKLSLLDEFRELRIQYDLVVKYNSIKIFSEMYSVCFGDIKKFVSIYSFLNDLNKKGETQFQKLKVTYLFLKHLNDLVWLFTEYSHTFRLNFHDSGATSTFINQYLSDEEFILNCLKFKLDKNKQYEENMSPGIQFLRALIGICHNLTKLIDNTKTDWTLMDATVKLMKFAQITNKYPDLRLSAYMAAANTMCEDDIDKLDATDVIKDIVKIINIGAESIVNKHDLKRTQIYLDTEDEKKNADVTVIIYRDSQYNIIELLETLNRIAVNDQIKYDLYQSYEMNQTLKMIIMEGNYIEKEYATKLLWQLCFDSRVNMAVLSDVQLLAYLMDFNAKTKEHSRYKSIKKNIFGILWLGSQYLQDKSMFKKSRNKSDEKKHKRNSSSGKIIENLHSSMTAIDASSTKINEQKQENENEIEKSKTNSVLRGIGQMMRFREKRDLTREKDDQTDRENEKKLGSNDEENRLSVKNEFDGHIMISYNKESRELCLKIKQELETSGYNVWIDVEDIHGSSLESMARAVENSICVLICMTEKYKLSPNCRAEAEYAFSLRKPIVPLIMQKDYAPDGWLGIILGSKIFINFTKYTFEECIKRTKNEITSIAGSNQYNFKLSKQTQIKKVPSNFDNKHTSFLSVSDWTSDDVTRWLSSNNINKNIKKMLHSFDGELLEKLFSIYKEAPEYYFKTLSQNNQIELFYVVKFTTELNKLFV